MDTAAVMGTSDLQCHPPSWIDRRHRSAPRPSRRHALELGLIAVVILGAGSILAVASILGTHRPTVISLRRPTEDSILHRMVSLEKHAEPVLHPHIASAEMQVTLPATSVGIRTNATSTSTDNDESTTVEALTDWDPRARCYQEMDLGLLDALLTSRRVFCPHPPTSDGIDEAQETEIALLEVPRGDVRAVVFRDLLLDFTKVHAHKPIRTLARDGGNHDPRYGFHEDFIRCTCLELASFAQSYRVATNRSLGLWDPALAKISRKDSDAPSTVCMPRAEPQMPVRVVEIATRAVLLPRKDDHNPFFQIASAFNAWLTLRALGWDSASTQLIQMDEGLPTPIDELQRRLLAPKQPVLDGRTLRNKRYRFTGQVLLPPFETTGPMMRHLDDDEPCAGSTLLAQFREAALGAFGLSPASAGPVKTSKAVTVTIISRRHYQGRRLRRRWLNEDEVLARLRETFTEHRGLAVRFQSLDFAELSVARQMTVMFESDVVIGMHGAGMVNVLWTRPETLVVEIFPKKRRRWGYRNLCRHLGCDWHEFRGGRDTGKGDNHSDKRIPVAEWLTFFRPLFLARLDAIASARASSGGENEG